MRSKVDFCKNLLVFFLVALGVFIYAEVYFLSYLGGGDFEGYGYWWIQLLKKHLLTEFSFPYFTPGRCGGFLLAADGQVYIFSLYTLVHFFVPHVIWSMKVTNFFLSLILAAGIYQWLFYLDIGRPARLFTGFLISISGYWVFHLTNAGTQLHVQSFAYLPWILFYIEKLFSARFGLDKANIRSGLWLILFFFLMGNGGYFWLQYFPYIFLGRLAAELIKPNEGRIQALKQTGFILFCFICAVILGWPHLGGFLEFQVAKFPRAGSGIIPHYGVIGDFHALSQALFQSFFDGPHLIRGEGNPHIGGFWEFSNFVGAFALIPMAIGLFRCKKFLRSKIFWTFVFASLIQLVFVRTTHAADLLRSVFPFFKSLTHYWRGSATLVLFASMWIALGYESFFQGRRPGLMFLGVFLMMLHFGEIHCVYQHRLNLSIDPLHNPSILDIGRDYKPVADVCEKQYAACELCHLFGYNYWGRIPEVLSFDPAKSVYDPVQEGHYNMHNIKELFSSRTDHGYFMKNRWPLWPKTDKADFEKFIRYKQVFPLPLKLKMMNTLSLLCWLVYGFLWAWSIFGRNNVSST